MTRDDFQKPLDSFGSQPVVVEAAEVNWTSAAGLVLIRQRDEVGGMTAPLTAALTDTRRQASVSHSFLQRVRSRVDGILADSPDQNDHDALRSDPVFKLIADRSPDDERDLACQSTHSRFAGVASWGAIDVPSLDRLRDVFIEPFIAAFDAPSPVVTRNLGCVRRSGAAPIK